MIARRSEPSDTLPGVDKRYLISQILQPLSAGSVQSSPMHASQSSSSSSIQCVSNFTHSMLDMR